MRFLILCQRPQLRGAEVFGQDLRRGLAQRGHSASVAFLYPYTGEAALPLLPGDVCLDGDDQSALERAIGAHPGLLRRLRAEVASVRPDVLVANGGRALKYAGLLRRLGTSRGKCIYRAIGDPRAWMTSTVARAFYRHIVIPGIDGVVAVSEETLRALRHVHGMEQPARVIPRGVDAARLAPARSRCEVRQAIGTPEDAPVVICLGSLSAEKRLDRAIRVLDHVRGHRDDVELWLVGDGPGRAELEGAASRRRPGAVRILGAHAAVADWLCAADVFLLPSDTEGTPGALLEAGLCGLPVVATNVGGVPECVRPGLTAELFDPGDEDGMATSVLRLVTEEARRARMGVAGREFVREKFSIERIVREWIMFAEELVTAGESL